MFIYKFTNNNNNKSYIGKDIHPISENRRYKYHKRRGTGEYLPELAFHHALIKYGFVEFTYEIIDECDDVNILNDLEIFWIHHHESFGINGYNMNPGGKGGHTYKFLSDEQKESRNEKIRQKCNEYWGKLSNKEQKIIIDRLQKGNKKYWDGLTEEKHNQHIEKFKNGYIKWWVSLSDEGKKEQGKKISDNIDSTQRTEENIKRWASYTKKEKIQVGKNIQKGQQKSLDLLTKEEITNRKKKSAKKYSDHYKNLSNQEKKERRKKSGDGVKKYWASLTPEQRKNHVKKKKSTD